MPSKPPAPKHIPPKMYEQYAISDWHRFWLFLGLVGIAVLLIVGWQT
jgi:hypothetical protein